MKEKCEVDEAQGKNFWVQRSEVYLESVSY